MSDGGDLLVHGPASGRLIGKVARSTADEVRAAIARARAAQADWGARPIADRAEVLRGARDRLLARADEVAELLARETGAPRPAVLLHDVAAHLELLTWATVEAERVLAPAPLPLRLLPHRAAYTHHAARGVVGVVGPAASPLGVGFGAVALALLAGNGVALRPSGDTPLHAALVREAYREGGLPTELLQLVYGGGDVDAALAAGGVDAIAVAGLPSEVAAVAGAAAGRGLPCLAEVHLPALALVLGDAPVERTVAALVAAAFGGQAGAVRRVVVDDRALAPALDALVTRTRALRPADPAQGDVAAIGTEAALHATEAWVTAAREAGATVSCGGARVAGEGRGYAPTVVSGGPPDLAIPANLGPVLHLLSAPGDDGLVAAANRGGPSALVHVFGGDAERARRVAERVDARLAIVNDGPVTALAAVHAWGGAEEALRAFTRTRAVNHPALPWLAPLVAAWLPGPTAAWLTRRYGRGPFRS